MDVWRRRFGSTRIKALLTSPSLARTRAQRPEIARLRSRVDELSASLPVVLNAIETANAGARARERRVRDLEERIASLEAAAAIARRADWRRAGLLAGETARLVLGFEQESRDGYVSIDDAPSPGIDVVADMRALPFDEASIEEIRAVHVVERFGRQDLRSEVLPHWYRLLRPGGLLVTVATDDGSVFRDAVAGRRSLDEVEEELFAHGRRGSVFTSSSLGELLVEAGFADVEIQETNAPAEPEPQPILLGHAVRPVA